MSDRCSGYEARGLGGCESYWVEEALVYQRAMMNLQLLEFNEISIPISRRDVSTPTKSARSAGTRHQISHR